LLGTAFGFAVVDEEARQVEKASHPGNDRDDVDRLDPQVEGKEEFVHGFFGRLRRGSRPIRG
jgi:hypothetical protein